VPFLEIESVFSGSIEKGFVANQCYVDCSFFCLDTKERTKKKIKAVKKTPEHLFAKLVAKKNSAHVFAKFQTMLPQTVFSLMISCELVFQAAFFSRPNLNPRSFSFSNGLSFSWFFLFGQKERHHLCFLPRSLRNSWKMALI